MIKPHPGKKFSVSPQRKLYSMEQEGRHFAFMGRNRMRKETQQKQHEIWAKFYMKPRTTAARAEGSEQWSVLSRQTDGLNSRAGYTAGNLGLSREDG